MTILIQPRPVITAPSQLSLAVPVWIQPGVVQQGLGWPQALMQANSRQRDTAWAWPRRQRGLVWFAVPVRALSPQILHARLGHPSRSGCPSSCPLLLLYNGRPFGAVPLHTKRWRASGGDRALNRNTRDVAPRDSQGRAFSPCGGHGSGWEPSYPLPLSTCPREPSFQSCGWREQRRSAVIPRAICSVAFQFQQTAFQFLPSPGLWPGRKPS